MDKVLLARIPTKSGGYICCIDDYYGEFRIFYADANMQVVRPANVSEWMWASSSWGKQLEYLEDVNDIFKVPIAKFNDLVNFPSLPALEETSICWRNEK